MPKKYTIDYHEFASPITEPVTKYGGNRCGSGSRSGP